MTSTFSITENAVLPMHPGYALGTIIKKSNLLMPIARKRLEELNHDLEVAERDQAKIIVSNCRDAEKEQKQQDIIISQVKINDLVRQRKDVIAQLQTSGGHSTEEMLPIDWVKSKMLIHSVRSSESIQIQYFTFSRTNSTDAFDVKDKVELMIKQLFSDKAPLSILPAGSIEGMSAGIETALLEKVDIAIMGAFAELPWVKTISPLVLRQESISEDLEKNSSDYCVLTEAVLGAVFLCYGKRIISGPINESMEKELQHFSAFSFISQGVIPKTNEIFEKNTLWSTYTSWRDKLDTSSGYPIAFKFRQLDNVLSVSKPSRGTNQEIVSQHSHSKASEGVTTH